MISLEQIEDISYLKQFHSQSLLGFSITSLPHYFNADPAPFHYDLAEVLQTKEIEMMEIIGFRGSAKTTFGSLATPLWSALTGQFKFIVLINDTSAQVELNLANIKYELENNKYLKRVYPNVKAEQTWSKNNLLLSNGVRIIGRSRGQKIRGIRHLQYRPDLVIVDDPEDLGWVQTKENRDKSERWFNAEVIPAVQEDNSKLIVIGNFLHSDALMARLKKNDLFHTIELPLVNAEGVCLWPGKYPTQAKLDRQRQKVGEVAWMREYMLKVVPEDAQVVKPEDIRRYDATLITSDIPSLRIQPTRGGVAIDLAISKSTSADYTAMVGGVMAKENDRDVLYINPSVVNKKMDLRETVQTGQHYFTTLPTGSKAYVENVAYQRAAVDEFERANMPVVRMAPIADKRARLETAAIYVKNGSVRFPDKGCEDLIIQLLGFGVEAHDDMVDALVYLILGMFGEKRGAKASLGRPTGL